MLGIRNILNRFSKSKNQVSSDQTIQGVSRSTVGQYNWYEDKFDSILVQRNILVVLLFIALGLAIISVGAVVYVSKSKSFDPFVIQIDDTTGMAKIVNPTDSNILDGNEALAEYFIKKYITARETYNPVDFATLARKTIRLLSSSNLYWEYIGYLKNDDLNPVIKYGQQNTTFLVVRSWSKLDKNKYILRFSINETTQARRVYNKIAVIEFQYTPMELTEQDRDINPLGFQVIGCRVDDDSS